MGNQKVVERKRVLFALLLLTAYFLIIIAFIFARENFFVNQLLSGNREVYDWKIRESIEYDIIQLAWLVGLTLIPYQWISSKVLKNKKENSFNFFIIYLLYGTIICVCTTIKGHQFFAGEKGNSIVAVLMILYILICIENSELEIVDWKKLVLGMICSLANFCYIYLITHSVTYASVLLISSVLVWNACMMIGEQKIKLPIRLMSILFLLGCILVIYLVNRDSYVYETLGDVHQEIFENLQDHPFQIPHLASDFSLYYTLTPYILRVVPFLFFSEKGAFKSVVLFMLAVVLWTFSSFVLAKKILTPKRWMVLISMTIIMLTGGLYCFLSAAGIVVAELPTTPFLGQTIFSDKIYLALLFNMIIFYPKKRKQHTSVASEKGTEFKETMELVILKDMQGNVFLLSFLGFVFMILAGISVLLGWQNSCLMWIIFIIGAVLFFTVCEAFDYAIEKRKDKYGIADDDIVIDKCRLLAYFKEISIWENIHKTFELIFAVSGILIFHVTLLVAAQEKWQYFSWSILGILFLYFMFIYIVAYTCANKAKQLELTYDLQDYREIEKDFYDFGVKQMEVLDACFDMEERLMHLEFLIEEKKTSG